ncbi:MAG: thiamine biosynthesis protein ThiS [Bacteroidetes bacterium HGW-Bacteroidetes-6]|jgi:thiazole synthase/sulfur carrier protein|nr:MAG: thiamine biosynthesis protein ThiS [Bacteroidetes bacterium HGW-Bacteroidetes-6]
MKIELNNNPETIEGCNNMTIQELIEYKKYSFKLLVVKINGVLIPKTDYSKASVKEGDEVMILHLMSGG